MGCCLAGCVRLIGFTLWKAIFAALIAIFLSQVDNYLDRSGKADSLPGKAWPHLARRLRTSLVLLRELARAVVLASP